jgi:hypothetical protein
MQLSNIETLDFEARWAELMMPVEEDNDTDPATVCPRDLELYGSGEQYGSIGTGF